MKCMDEFMVLSCLKQYKSKISVWAYTVNLCLVTNKYKNPSCTNITVPQKYVFDFKE